MNIREKYQYILKRHKESLEKLAEIKENQIKALRDMCSHENCIEVPAEYDSWNDRFDGYRCIKKSHRRMCLSCGLIEDDEFDKLDDNRVFVKVNRDSFHEHIKIIKGEKIMKGENE